jgi:SAM-dependent MidA family methyltransferase
VSSPSGGPLNPGVGLSGNPLRARIAAEIRRRGPIPFSRYMEMCLYEPELGYYARPREQFGKAGDFCTSSDVHAVFGRLLARQFEEMWRLLGSPERIDLIELGPGRGLFAADVLHWSAKQFPKFARSLCYSLVEQSAHLRQRLQERLAEHIAAGRARIFDSLQPPGAEAPALHLSFLRDSGSSSAGLSSAAPPAPVSSPLDPAREPDEDASSRMERHSLAQHGGEAGGLEDEPINSPESRSDGTHAPPLILFANEFFDALPVDILDHRGAVRVAEEQGSFTEQFVTPSSAELDYIDRYSVHPEEHERVEVSLAALDWIDHIAQLFHRRRGFAMFVDYGYTREEQLAGRHRDTLMTYHRHRASASPYDAPGEQDITAHVNFTALRSRAVEQGLEQIALVTQTQLLLGIGEEAQFADAFQECRLPQERAKVALQLRHLLSPEEMGEKFHALLLSRGVSREDAMRLSAVKLLAGR